MAAEVESGVAVAAARVVAELVLPSRDRSLVSSVFPLCFFSLYCLSYYSFISLLIAGYRYATQSWMRRLGRLQAARNEVLM